MESSGNITSLLASWASGDTDAFEQLIPLVLHDLRMIASSYMAREPQDHTLQPTAVVNELYLKLTGMKSPVFDDRKAFFVFAANLIRRILIDHARMRHSQKRGGAYLKTPLEDAFNIGESSSSVDTMIDLDMALDKLARFDSRAFKILELRYFAGLTVEEIAELLELSRATVKRDWMRAKYWLSRELYDPKQKD